MYYWLFTKNWIYIPCRVILIQFKSNVQNKTCSVSVLSLSFKLWTSNIILKLHNLRKVCYYITQFAFIINSIKSGEMKKLLKWWKVKRFIFFWIIVFKFLFQYTVNYPDTFEEVLCCIILIFHTQNIKKLKRRWVIIFKSKMLSF